MSLSAADRTAPGDVRSLFAARAPSALVAAADHSEARLTYVFAGVPATETGRALEPVRVTVPTTAAAGSATDLEARLLVELRRKRLGPIETTIPRYVATRRFEGRPVLVTSVVPGEPMPAGAPPWMQAARRQLVRHHLAISADWLARLQDASSVTTTGSTWVGSVADGLRQRWGAHPSLTAGLARLVGPSDRLDGLPLQRTVVHGNFCSGNVLVHDARVSGVVNWSHGEAEGSPLRDLARFVLTYPWRPDRIGVALLGGQWSARMLRGFLADGLERLGAPRERWYDVALAGLAELAATSGDDRLAAGHLEALATLPLNAPVSTALSSGRLHG